MRAHSLINELFKRFIPDMDKSEREELQSEAFNQYNQWLNAVKAKQVMNAKTMEENTLMKDEKDYVPQNLIPLTLRDKVMLLLESWYVRYIFAGLYIYLIPKIKSYINGEPAGAEEGEEDSDESLLQELLEYKRLKKQLR